MSNADFSFNTPSPIDKNTSIIKMPLRGFVNKDGDYYTLNEPWTILIYSDGESIHIEEEDREVFGVSQVSLGGARDMLMEQVEEGGYDDEFTISGRGSNGISLTL